MEQFNYKFNSVRMIARGLSVASTLILCLFVIGNGFNPFAMRLLDLIAFLFFPTCVVIGMIISWFDELEGSLFSIMSLGIFYIIMYISRRHFPGGPWFLIFTLPAIIFLIFSVLNLKTYIRKLKSKSRKRLN